MHSNMLVVDLVTSVKFFISNHFFAPCQDVVKEQLVNHMENFREEEIWYFAMHPVVPALEVDT